MPDDCRNTSVSVGGNPESPEIGATVGQTDGDGTRPEGLNTAPAGQKARPTAGFLAGSGLVLSLFPGIGLLDLAFEEEGFCVVRGPDLLWGGDIRRFHPPAGKFDGVIGGPPCQAFSGLANFAYRWKRQPVDLIPEFERVVAEAGPFWFVMENVPGAPLPTVKGYVGRSVLINNRMFGAAQDRERRITFGTDGGARLDSHIAAEVQKHAINGEHHATVTAAHGGGRPRMRGNIEAVTVEQALGRQGLPEDFYGEHSPFRRSAQQKMAIQGVPLPMGRAIARAVRAYHESTAAAHLLSEHYSGPAYLALPWPESCPYTPERVMAACERRGLTPEFMAEPKRCEHVRRPTPSNDGFVKCCKCGAILSDRRKGERRGRDRRFTACNLHLGCDPTGRRDGRDRRSHDRRTRP